MQCPRCHTEITSVPDPGGFMNCPGCGARLMTRSTAAKAGPRPAAPSSPSLPTASPGPHPSATLPPGTPLKRIPRPGEDTARSRASAARKTRAPAETRTPAEAPAPTPAPARGLEQPATLEAILDELRALRHMQGEILMLLRPRAEAEPAEGPGAGDEHPAIVPPVRSRRRKTVLVIDDDPEARAATVAALQQAEVPVRAVEGGREGLEAIASEKPDVIVLELEVGGDMAGRDVINMLKATMDWLDIPIVLYTRSPVESQKEARTIHGADELVSKAAGPEALVPRIIALFRRG